MSGRRRTPWPVAAPRVSRTLRRLPNLRDDDGDHTRCERCGWFDVEGTPDLDDAVFLYDLHQMLAHP